MPGRPKRLAEKATEMEAMTYVCAGEIYLTVPRKYLDEPDRPNDILWQRWKLVVELSGMLHAQAFHLANALRAKANMPAIVNDDEPPSNGKLEPA